MTLATYEIIMQSLPLSPKTLANWSLVNCGVALRTSATCLPTLEFPTTTELSPPFSSARILHSSNNFSIFSTVFFKPSVALEFSAFFSVFVALNASNPTRSASSKCRMQFLENTRRHAMSSSSESSSLLSFVFLFLFSAVFLLQLSSSHERTDPKI